MSSSLYSTGRALKNYMADYKKLDVNIRLRFGFATYAIWRELRERYR